MTRDVPDDEVSTYARPRIERPAIAEESFALVVAEGPDAGTSIRIDGASPSPLLVGSSPACDLRLTDREVSRRHAAFEIQGGRVRVADRQSTNGTFIGNTAIIEGYAEPGDLVRLGGKTKLRLERLAPSASPTSATSATSAPLPLATRFGRVIGVSREMRRLYPLCARLAASTVPVIIEGETGTGKEVLAESIHEQGPRASGPFVVFDCTAVPPSLVESELFGHERGAFTGAVSTRKGVFEQAHGGTLLIDEIGDLDIALQPKLLRAIERSEVRRIGSDRTLRVDVRLLCATRRDLDREVLRQTFRDDLFHRLAVARIELPPLRRRINDVALLAGQFCRDLGGDEHRVHAGLVARWEGYSWPGNVRELRNFVARWVALGDIEGASGDLGDDDEAATASSVMAPTGDPYERVLALGLPLIQARQRIVEEFERRYIERILAEQGGNVARAAGASGIARRHFQRLRARTR